MKKVRYAIGAIPVIALIPAAAAHAAVAPAQSAPSNTKAVSLRHTGLTPAVPAVDCGSGHHVSRTQGDLHGEIVYSGVCVLWQYLRLNHDQTKLTERTRYYSGGGALERTTWQTGRIGDNSTSFSSFPNVYATEVCQALVANSNHNDVKYGPMCLPRI
jgi:hypothetical protein